MATEKMPLRVVLASMVFIKIVRARGGATQEVKHRKKEPSRLVASFWSVFIVFFLSQTFVIERGR